MKTLYLDHNILVHENNWPLIEAATKNNFLLVLSDYNLLEIAQGTDRDQAIRRIDFILGLNPWWCISRKTLQEYEVYNFFCRRFYKGKLNLILPFTGSIVDMLKNALHMDVPSNYSAKDQVLGWLDNPDYLEGVMLAKQSYLDSQARLHTVSNQELKNKSPAIFKGWLKPFLPEIAQMPEAPRFINPLDYCWERKEEFFNECKTFAIEEDLFDIFFKKKRKPELSDVIDVEHAAFALAYCDCFITNDGHLSSAVEYVARRRPTPAIYRSLADL